VGVEARDKSVSVEVRDKSVSVEVRDKSVSVEVRDKSVSAEVRDKSVSVEVTDNSGKEVESKVMLHEGRKAPIYTSITLAAEVCLAAVKRWEKSACLFHSLRTHELAPA
jgi:hypothetical protein